METDRGHALRQAITTCGNGGVVSIAGVYGGFVDTAYDELPSFFGIASIGRLSVYVYTDAATADGAVRLTSATLQPIAVSDLAAIVANVFDDTDRFVGADLALAADVAPIAECRRRWREVMGRPPLRVPMPVWLFERFVGTDETTMWRWLRVNDIDLATRLARELCPQALGVRAWLRVQRAWRSHPPQAPRPAPDPT